MRSRFEDVKLGHKILTSPVDGIKSHFKTSYSLIIKLLETRTIDECKKLIERGFGSYIFMKKLSKKPIEQEEVVPEVEYESESKKEDSYRDVLLKYGLKDAREFVKISRRIDKEKGNLDYLLQKISDTDDDLITVL
jgi:superfamily II RNA helicase